eukprot:gene8505-971_t
MRDLGNKFNLSEEDERNETARLRTEVESRKKITANRSHLFSCEAVSLKRQVDEKQGRGRGRGRGRGLGRGLVGWESQCHLSLNMCTYSPRDMVVGGSTRQLWFQDSCRK